MTEEREPEGSIERAIARAFAPQRRLSRRTFLRDAGRGGIYMGSAVSLGAILAACGIAPQSSTTPTAATGGSPTPRPSKVGFVQWANWPEYIDIDDDGNYPTLDKFKKETGIQVNYVEAINDNEDFFGSIQPDLQAGGQLNWDMIVMTDWMIERMIRLNYLEPLDHSQLPNFTANADQLYVDPWYDKGNKFSTAWQSGITGIGYNPKLTKREITSIDDLFDPAFKGRVGMFSDMRDDFSLVMLSQGVKLENATLEDVRKARDKIRTAREQGQFRAFYGNEYYDELSGGNLAVSIAWSGDISQMQLYDNPDIKFVIPESGGMRWVDNMALPARVKHPIDAHMLMNFWYDPVNAQTLSEYIGYFSPVKNVPNRIQAHAQDVQNKGDKETADQLRFIASTIEPTKEELDRVFYYKVLDEDEERQWNELFQDASTG
jgi:spermidine/putrescine transport system substrate-binding protein